MSDLCQNCGDCHLPRPCPLQLKHCDICGSWGHNYNFCPLSVRKKDPNYQFWALCHNCDSWHLPDECKLPLHKCVQCSHTSHLEYFCPVNALSRQATVALNDAKTGTKRPRTSESEIKRDDTNVNDPLRGEHIRLIKAEAAREVMDLRNRGYTDGDILQHITASPLQSSYGNRYAASPPGDSVSKTSNPIMTPLTTSTSIPKQPATPSSTSLYASQQERFSNGQLLQSVTSNYQTPNVSDPSIGFTNTPAPRKKGNRAPSNSACPECKGSKKRCSQKGGTIGMDVDNRQLVNSALVPPSGYVDAHLMLTNGTQASQDWMSTFGNNMTGPFSAGDVMQNSSSNTHSTPNIPMSGFEKNGFAQLLNNSQATSQDEQTPSGTFKPFTYSTVQYDFPQHTGHDTNKQLPPMSVVPGGGVVNQMSTRQTQPMMNQAKANDIVMAPNATQESVQEPEPGKEPSQEPTQEPEPSQESNTEAKAKKGRGRPKRA